MLVPFSVIGAHYLGIPGYSLVFWILGLSLQAIQLCSAKRTIYNDLFSDLLAVRYSTEPWIISLWSMTCQEWAAPGGTVPAARGKTQGSAQQKLTKYRDNSMHTVCSSSVLHHRNTTPFGSKLLTILPCVEIQMIQAE
jgi:hypothetical protein